MWRSPTHPVRQTPSSAIARNTKFTLYRRRDKALRVREHRKGPAVVRCLTACEGLKFSGKAIENGFAPPKRLPEDEKIRGMISLIKARLGLSKFIHIAQILNGAAE